MRRWLFNIIEFPARLFVWAGYGFLLLIAWLLLYSLLSWIWLVVKAQLFT